MPAKKSSAGGRPPRARKNAAAAESAPTPEADGASGALGDSEPGPTPEFVDLDRPPPGLPELTFPSSELREAREAAAQRRRSRLRVELIGGGVLLVFGGGVALVTRTVAILLLAAILLGGVIAYELLVTNLE